MMYSGNSKNNNAMNISNSKSNLFYNSGRISYNNRIRNHNKLMTMTRKVDSKAVISQNEIGQLGPLDEQEMESAEEVHLPEKETEDKNRLDISSVSSIEDVTINNDFKTNSLTKDKQHLKDESAMLGGCELPENKMETIMRHKNKFKFGGMIAENSSSSDSTSVKTPVMKSDMKKRNLVTQKSVWNDDSVSDIDDSKVNRGGDVRLKKGKSFGERDDDIEIKTSDDDCKKDLSQRTPIILITQHNDELNTTSSSTPTSNLDVSVDKKKIGDMIDVGEVIKKALDYSSTSDISLESLNDRKDEVSLKKNDGIKTFSGIDDTGKSADIEMNIDSSVTSKRKNSFPNQSNSTCDGDTRNLVEGVLIYSVFLSV